MKVVWNHPSVPNVSYEITADIHQFILRQFGAKNHLSGEEQRQGIEIDTNKIICKDQTYHPNIKITLEKLMDQAIKLHPDVGNLYKLTTAIIGLQNDFLDKVKELPSRR